MKTDIAVWHCSYCDRENPGDRVTCAGCQAPRRRERETLRLMTYKGRPLSTLTDAEMDEAAGALLNMNSGAEILGALTYDQPIPSALVDAIKRRLVALYKGPHNWANIQVVDGFGEDQIALVSSNDAIVTKGITQA